MLVTRKFDECPRCSARLRPTENLLGGPSTDWLECEECNTFVDTYQPMAHQFAVHRDEHIIIGNFGAYGSGKTKTSAKEIEKHILITPGASILVGANVTSQYEQTIQRDFERSFPAAFMRGRSLQKGYIDFINDARLSFRPFDDPDKLRSNNYSMVVMLEASEINPEAFHQIKTRTRNLEATVLDRDKEGNLKLDKLGRPIVLYDWRKIIIESNPDSGWIRSEVLMYADSITQHGSVNDEYKQDPSTIDKNISVHVTSTDANRFLPPNYIEVNSKNKPQWWINKYIHASFNFSEGLVYPAHSNSFVQSYEIDPSWLRVVAHDYGLNDNATFIFGAIDKERGKLVIYKEIVVNNRNIESLANLYKEGVKDIPVGGWYTQPIIDPKNNKRDYNKKDLISHYSEYGVYFKPGHVNLDARIFRLNTYFETGRIEIFEDKCPVLVEELKGYKFPDRILSTAKRLDKPVDANNHCINPVEWIVMELPADPARLSLLSYDMHGRTVEDRIKEQTNTIWQLQDDYDYKDDYYGVDFEGGLI